MYEAHVHDHKGKFKDIVEARLERNVLNGYKSRSGLYINIVIKQKYINCCATLLCLRVITPTWLL